MPSYRTVVAIPFKGSKGRAPKGGITVLKLPKKTPGVTVCLCVRGCVVLRVRVPVRLGVSRVTCVPVLV